MICRVNKHQREVDRKCSESCVVELGSAAVVNVAGSALQNSDTSHDRQEDQSEHHSVFNSGRAVVAFQESDEALHGGNAARAKGEITFSVTLLPIPPVVQ